MFSVSVDAMRQGLAVLVPAQIGTAVAPGALMSIHQSDSRSDERIHDAVCDRLDDDYDVDATLIEVSVTDGEVVLLGSVPVARMKTRAEVLAQGVSGVKDVDNELGVSEEHTEIPLDGDGHSTRHSKH